MTAGTARLADGTRLVHIGPHKTGSTAIQVALHSVGPRLAEHGVAYVTAGAYRPRKAGWALGVRGRPSGTAKPPVRYWRRFAAAVDAAESPLVCVSNEDFGRATPRQVHRLVSDLGGERVHVLAVARRLDRYLPSQWQERVKAGDERSYEEWLGVVLATDDPEPNWDRRNVWFSHDVRALSERWVHEVGPDRFTLIVSDESDRTVIPRTFETLLGLPHGFVVPDPSRSNRGLSWGETELLRAANEVLEGQGVARHRRRPLLTNGVLRDMQARPAPPGPSSPPFPERWVDRLRALSDDRVAAVRALVDQGAHVVGDPELMRMPEQLEVAASPLPSPPLDVTVAAEALASALALSLEQPDEPGPDDAPGAAPGEG